MKTDGSSRVRRLGAWDREEGVLIKCYRQAASGPLAGLGQPKAVIRLTIRSAANGL